MALFRRKKETTERVPTDSRSKRGGVRRQTSVRIDLSELENRAAPPVGAVPAPAPAASGPGTQRMPAPAKAHAAVSRRSTRIAGRGTPIGALLIQAGAVNQDQVNQALRAQQKQGGLLGHILVAMGACLPLDVAEALGKQFRFTQVDLSRFKPKIDALVLLTSAKCRELKVIPFERLEQIICVAMVNVLNRKAITQVETLTKLKVKGFTCTWPQIQQAIKKFYVPKVEEGAKKVEEMRSTGARVDEFAIQVAHGIRKSVEAARASKRVAEAAAPQEAAPAARPEVEAENYIRGAQALRAQGKIQEALKRLKAGAAAVPGSKKLAALFRQVAGEAEARAKQEHERLARVAELLAKGRADRGAGNYAEAARNFEEAIRLDPENRVISREVAGVQKELTRKRAEGLARKKADEEAKALEEKRRAEDRKRREREVEQLMGLARDAQAQNELDETASRLKDVLSIDPVHAAAITELGKVEAVIAERERKRAEDLAARLVEAKAAEKQKELEEVRAKEEAKRKRAHVRAVLRGAGQDRDAGRFEIALRKLKELAEEAPDRKDVKEAIGRVEEDLEKKRAKEEKRRKAEDEERDRAEEEIQRRAAAAAEVQAERQRLSVAATGGEKRVGAREVTEDSLVEIEITPESWHARIAEAMATQGGEAASTEEALKRLPVAQRYARSREELASMAAAARAAVAALEEVEEVSFGDEEAEIEAILEAIPEGELEEGELAEVAEVIAIPETRAEAQAISQEEFDRLEPELEPDPVLEWLVTCAGFGRAAVVPVED